MAMYKIVYETYAIVEADSIVSAKAKFANGDYKNCNKIHNKVREIKEFDKKCNSGFVQSYISKYFDSEE